MIFFGVRSCLPKLTQPYDLFRLSLDQYYIQAEEKFRKRNQLYPKLKRKTFWGLWESQLSDFWTFFCYFDVFKWGVNPALVRRFKSLCRLICVVFCPFPIAVLCTTNGGPLCLVTGDLRYWFSLYQRDSFLCASNKSKRHLIFNFPRYEKWKWWGCCSLILNINNTVYFPPCKIIHSVLLKKTLFSGNRNLWKGSFNIVKVPTNTIKKHWTPRIINEFNCLAFKEVIQFGRLQVVKATAPRWKYEI